MYREIILAFGVENLNGFITRHEHPGVAHLTAALAVENGFVKQASVESLLHKYGFDEEGVLSFVTSAED